MQKEHMKWWQQAVIYQIYPYTFADANGDGTGDLQGITGKLEYLKDLGVDTLCIGPLALASSDRLKAEDFCGIDPVLGSMEDFEHLIYEAGKYQLKILLELCAGRQPLNLADPGVQTGLQNVLRFWMERGAAGFCMDLSDVIWNDNVRPDGQKKRGGHTGRSKKRTAIHRYFRELRKTVDEFGGLMMARTKGLNTKQARRMVVSNRKEFHMILSDTCLPKDSPLPVVGRFIRRRFRWRSFMNTFEKWQRFVPWNAFYLEAHGEPRSIDRIGNGSSESGALIETLLFTLKGTPVLFQGQERGERTEGMIDWETRNELVYARCRDLIRMRRQDNDLLAGDFEILRNTKSYTVYRRGKSMVQLNHSKRTNHGLLSWETRILKP